MKLIPEIIELDNEPKLGYLRAMEHCFMIQNEKNPLVYYRNEKARFWADNTILGGVSATDYIAQEALKNNAEYLIIHPEDDKEDIPFDYNGWVIRFGKELKPNFSN